VTVDGGAAVIRIACSAAGPCAGVVGLTAKVKGKRKVLGRTRYSVPAGRSRPIRVKLNGLARRMLEGGAVEVRVSGAGAARTVVLKAGSRG
jgi:hypothetical protein